MKNQYFGDINDFKKYGLLRCISDASNLAISVAWMLTPDDKSTDGKFTSYLSAPQKWRQHDPELFDSLASTMSDGTKRHVGLAQKTNLIPSARYFDRTVPDSASQRNSWFEELVNFVEPSDLVFLDPDNGIEVKSRPYGKPKSSKYLYWRELEALWGKGKSILVYQHFIREKRPVFIQRMLTALHERTPGSLVSAFSTANVVFLLALQPPHHSHDKPIQRAVAESWAGSIKNTKLVSNRTPNASSEAVTQSSEASTTSIASNPDVKRYLQLMREINSRFEACEKVLNRDIDLRYQRTTAEFLALQLRLILESIILSSLSAHTEIFERARNQLKKEHKVKNLVPELKKHNPYFFPVPLSQESSKTILQFINGHDNSLTLDELITEHGQTGELLHVPNPYKKSKIDYQAYINRAEEVLVKAAKLLAVHSILLHSHDQMILVFMKDLESGQPKALNAKAVGPLTVHTKPA